MANPKPIMLAVGQKGLSRRALLAGLSFSSFTLCMPLPSFAAAMSGDTSPLTAADTDDHPVLSLPFVRDTSGIERALGADPRLFWSVQPTGDFMRDCATGADYASAALDYMVAANAPEVLSWAVFDMMALPRARSGVEVGFLSTFGRIATKAHATNLRAGGVA